MSNENKRHLINKISELSTGDHPMNLTHRKGKPFAMIVSAEDYQKFQLQCEEKLRKLKTEMKGILALVRSHTQGRSLEDVEAHLAALRQQIEQEAEK